jgi:hypothetical protein
MSWWYGGINGDDDIKDCTPDSFRFHSTFKSLIRMILAVIGRVKTPESWLTDMTGNMAVLRDIYYQYLENEQQTMRPGEGSPLRAMQDRKTILSSAIPFSLAVAFYDPNYREVAEWFLYQICQAYERGELKFTPVYIFPECWYQDGRGRGMPDYKEAIKFLEEQNGKRQAVQSA